MLPNIIEHFSALPDPRRDHPNKLHKLIDIIVITVWGLLANQETWLDISEFAEETKDILKQYLELPNGIPSHDTLSRAFALINSEVWEELFFTWMEQRSLETRAFIRRFQIDGKILRGTRSTGTGKREEARTALNIVSVWGSEERLVLKQTAVESGSNEIKAAQTILNNLNLKNAVVSLDAIHAQVETLTQIKKQKGDYVVGIKKNQRNLHQAVRDLFEDQQKTHSLDTSKTFDVAHGRQEERICVVLRDLARLKDADCRVESFTGLKSIFVVNKVVVRGGKESREQRFYLSSLECAASQALELVRGHWSIENQEHYVLDVTFHEDASRTRRGFAGRNLALVRRMVLNILSLDADKTVSVRRKRVRAARDSDYALRLLGFHVSH